MPLRSAGLLLGAAAVLGLLVFVSLGRQQRGPVPMAPAPAREAPVASAGIPLASTPTPDSEATLDERPLPRSLLGTEPDGGLATDASGAFVPTRDALDLFDYYLSATGEEPLEAIVARIERAIRARVDPPDEALDLLDRYLAYRSEVRRLVETEGLLALPLEQRLQLLRETRRGVFGAALAARLFEEGEARTRDAVARRRIATDPTLTPEERARELAAFESELPEEVQAARARVTVAQRLMDEEAALRIDGASEAEIQAHREQQFGPEAARRLAALDRARAEWDARVARYRAERARLDTTSMSDEDRVAAVEALRGDHFEGPDLVRIRALDSMTEGARRGPGS